MKKTVLVIAVVGLLFGAMCATTVSAEAGLIGRMVRRVASGVQRARANVNSGRAIFNRGRAVFNGGRALFNRGRAVFNGGRALLNRGRAVFNGGRAVFNRVRAIGNSGRALFNRGRSVLNLGRSGLNALRSGGNLAYGTWLVASSGCGLNPIRAARGAFHLARGARLGFKSARLGLKSVRLGFKATRLRFKSVRQHFKATRLRAKSLRLHFKSTRLRFKSLRQHFKATRLRAKSLRLHFKASRLRFKAMRQRFTGWLIKPKLGGGLGKPFLGALLGGFLGGLAGSLLGNMMSAPCSTQQQQMPCTGAQQAPAQSDVAFTGFVSEIHANETPEEGSGSSYERSREINIETQWLNIYRKQSISFSLEGDQDTVNVMGLPEVTIQAMHGETGEVYEEVTDESGEYMLPVPEPNVYQLIAMSEPHGMIIVGENNGTAIEEDTKEVSFIFPKLSKIKGYVLDEDDEPISDATVYAAINDSSIEDEDAIMQSEETGQAYYHHYEPETDTGYYLTCSAENKTDDEGYYELEVAQEGDYVLVVDIDDDGEADKYARITVGPEEPCEVEDLQEVQVE